MALIVVALVDAVDCAAARLGLLQNGESGPKSGFRLVFAGPVHCESTMNQPAICLRTQTQMTHPFLIPDRLQGARCDLANHREDMRSAECAEPLLLAKPVVADIGIAGVKGAISPEQDQGGVQIRL